MVAARETSGSSHISRALRSSGLFLDSNNSPASHLPISRAREDPNASELGREAPPPARSYNLSSHFHRVVPTVSGRSTVCFFNTLRTWVRCGTSLNTQQQGTRGIGLPLPEDHDPHPLLDPNCLPDEQDELERQQRVALLYHNLQRCNAQQQGPQRNCGCGVAVSRRLCGGGVAPGAVAGVNCAVTDSHALRSRNAARDLVGGSLLPIAISTSSPPGTSEGSGTDYRGRNHTQSKPSSGSRGSRIGDSSQPSANRGGSEMADSHGPVDNDCERTVNSGGAIQDSSATRRHLADNSAGRPFSMSRSSSEADGGSNNRHSGLAVPTAVWSTPYCFMTSSRSLRRRHEVLKQQGLYYLFCGTLPLLILPAGLATKWITPEIARQWALSFAKWLGIRTTAGVEAVILKFLNGGLLMLTISGSLALFFTAVKDPGRIPRGYHWIAAATPATALDSQISTAATRSHRTLAVVAQNRQQHNGMRHGGRDSTVSQQILGAVDLYCFQAVFPNSSFSPQLHGPNGLPAGLRLLAHELTPNPNGETVTAELSTSTGSRPRHWQFNQAKSDRAGRETTEETHSGTAPMYIPGRVVRQWLEFVEAGTAHQWGTDISPCPGNGNLAGGRNTGRGTATIICEEANSERGELPTDVLALLKGDVVPLKWCSICKHVRQPRTRHCRNCRCCIDRFDHHCVWVCNCVGLRNHRNFLSFVSCACVTNAYLLVISVILFKHNWVAFDSYSAYGLDSTQIGRVNLFFSHFGVTVADNPVAFIILLLALLLILPMANLLLFHFVLLASNRTTTEEMRELYLDHNPFDLGGWRNLFWLLWRSPPPSLLTRFGRPTNITFRRLEPRRWGGSSTLLAYNPDPVLGPGSPFEDKLIDRADYARHSPRVLVND